MSPFNSSELGPTSGYTNINASLRSVILNFYLGYARSFSVPFFLPIRWSNDPLGITSREHGFLSTSKKFAAVPLIKHPGVLLFSSCVVNWSMGWGPDVTYFKQLRRNRSIPVISSFQGFSFDSLAKYWPAYHETNTTTLKSTVAVKQQSPGPRPGDHGIPIFFPHHHHHDEHMPDRTCPHPTVNATVNATPNGLDADASPHRRLRPLGEGGCIILRRTAPTSRTPTPRPAASLMPPTQTPVQDAHPAELNRAMDWDNGIDDLVSLNRHSITPFARLFPQSSTNWPAELKYYSSLGIGLKTIIYFTTDSTVISAIGFFGFDPSFVHTVCYLTIVRMVVCQLMSMYTAFYLVKAIWV
ncbi:hypothetical protein B0H16DRAFT_1479019 [Mycena metata]|uniref:Uncharacterized protein n=1 Tax=Mycena metata TaxID=1033252 RepID=A0AAD7ME54_9AGAR|nr:hypothetical protein B0H16DRAFT_1479019 [Mycena metata]